MSGASAARPRAHVHRGCVRVEALWFDLALLGEAEARRRVLAAWAPGAGVYALEGGLLLRLPAARRMECAQAPGLPFTLEEDVLLSAPLSRAERTRLAPAPGSAVWVRAGAARVHALEASCRVDVSAWLDVSGWEVVVVEGLGVPPPPIALPVAAASPGRERFGIGAPSPEAEAMRARMEGRPVPVAPVVVRPGLLARLLSWRRGRRAAPGTASPAPGALSKGDRPLHAWERALLELSSLIRRVFREDSRAVSPVPAAAKPAPSARAEPPARPSEPGLLSRLGSRLSRWLATSTPLGGLLGQRKAEYVQRLFELFDEGQLDEALRHAIPLSQRMSEDARVSLGLPGPRETLAIKPGAEGGAGSVFGGGEEVYKALRERYREAFRKLEREGRIEEAAFILAELLHENEEAVSFLERHGRLRLAAELAEGRQLAPGLVVRQWLLAGEMARAMDLARRTGSFGDALPRLERTHPGEARRLRMVWGEVLADSGDFVRAVDVVWPLEDLRWRCREWLERGVDIGGVAGARMLARLALAFPAHFEDTRTRVLALLESDAPEGAVEREAFTQALAGEKSLQEPESREGRLLLRPALRALLRDLSAGHVSPSARDLQALVLLTGDPVLKADLPPSPPVPKRAAEVFEGAPRTHVLGEGEGGSWPIRDAVRLPGGRLLVALGEAGARLVTAQGRCVAHFDVPAFSLVLSRHGDRALALAPRGTLQRVSRLDLVRRRAEAWCDTRADAFATEYDGDLWFLAVEDTVMAVDALAAQPRALWRVPQVGGRVRAMAAGPGELSFVTLGAGAELERWTYVLPDLTLRSRQVLPGREGLELEDLSLRATGELVASHSDGERWLLPIGRGAVPAPPMFGGEARARWSLGGVWLAERVHTPRGGQVRLIDRGRRRMCATFLFEGGSPVSARFLPQDLLLFDAVGRLVWVDLERGQVRRVVLR